MPQKAVPTSSTTTSIARGGAGPMTGRTPDANPDAQLLAHCSEMFTICNLLAAIDAQELDIDSAGLASALSRFWVVVFEINRTRAASEGARIAKVRCASIALKRYFDAKPQKILELVGSALSDVLTAWDDERERRVRP